MRPVKRLLVGALTIATAAVTAAANPGMAGSVSDASHGSCSFSDVGPATLSYSGSLNGDTAVTVHFHGKASCTGGAAAVYTYTLDRSTTSDPHLNCTQYNPEEEAGFGHGLNASFPKVASDGTSACQGHVFPMSQEWLSATSYTFQLKNVMTPCSTNSTWAYPNYQFLIYYAYKVDISYLGERYFSGGVAKSSAFKLWWGCFN
jgi:hypothetical protein